MALKNSDIAKRIREARKQQKLTQEDLARHLGRTSAAISDLERGKVQVTAIDLYKLTKLLLKPIEYFYGEDFGGKDVQDIVAAFRRAPASVRKDAVPTMRYLLRMEELSAAIMATKDKAQSIELVREFLGIMSIFTQQVNQMSGRNQEMQSKIAEALQIEFPNPTTEE